MQATSNPNPGTPACTISGVHDWPISKAKTYPTKVVQCAYNLQFSSSSTESQTMETLIRSLTVVPSQPCLCHLSSNPKTKRPTKSRFCGFCTLRFPNLFPLIFLATTVDPRSVSQPPPLQPLVSRYVHPTRHIAVKLASDTSLCANARMCTFGTILGNYRACAPYVVHICWVLCMCASPPLRCHGRLGLDYGRACQSQRRSCQVKQEVCAFFFHQRCQLRDL